MYSFPHFSLTCFDILSWNFAYSEIIYFRGAQFSWIHENRYIRGDVISWVGWLVFPKNHMVLYKEFRKPQSIKKAGIVLT